MKFNEVTFCSRCGRRLIEFSDADGFDPVSGEPNMSFFKVCPLYRKASFGSRHDYIKDVHNIPMHWSATYDPHERLSKVLG